MRGILKIEQMKTKQNPWEITLSNLSSQVKTKKRKQVSNLENGCPQVTVTDERAKDLMILISLTHTKEYALATAVVQKWT